MNWANGEDIADRRGSSDSGSVSLGIFVKVFIAFMTGGGSFLALEVIDHGKKLAGVEEKFNRIVEAVDRLERKIDSFPPAGR